MNARDVMDALRRGMELIGGHHYAPPVAPQKHVQHRWDELGGSLVGVHLCATTHPGALVGHTKHRRRLRRRRAQ